VTPLCPPELTGIAAGVRLAAFDVDGVLTNGQLFLGPGGEEYKVFNVRDGHGLVMLRDSGLAIAIITGRRSPVVAARMAELGIEYVYQGQHDKLAALAELEAKLGIRSAEVCYVGDDLPDVPVLKTVGLPVTVADGHPCCVAVARYQTRAAGGSGAVREVCELLMSARGTLAAQHARYGL
jgi:3-deoxy-D-manno-octulosonate 8-phosphate phosphatase (KDO 8-P phosphatase)